MAPKLLYLGEGECGSRADGLRGFLEDDARQKAAQQSKENLLQQDMFPQGWTGRAVHCAHTGCRNVAENLSYAALTLSRPVPFLDLFALGVGCRPLLMDPQPIYFGQLVSCTSPCTYGLHR